MKVTVLILLTAASIAAASAQTPAKPAATPAKPSAAAFVPLPTDISCSFREGAGGVRMVPGNGPNGAVPEHFEVPGSLTCSITGSEPKEVPLVSKGTVVDGKLETRDFGDFRMTTPAGAGNFPAVAAIESDKLQAFRNFLSKPAAALTPWIKLPPGVPTVAHGPIEMPIALRYEDIKVGTGPEGESGKVWHLKYTGWRAADGVKFDSWEDHKMPVMGTDGKPELGPDGKPKMGDPQPMAIPQGVGRVIPGFDYGLTGMKIGGKRRLFIPWQMAYGTHVLPDRPDHPGIPAKSDLIFDVELVDVTDMPAPQRATMPIQHPDVAPQPGASPQPNAAPAAPATPAASAPAQPSTPAQSAAPAQPAAPAPSSTPAPATAPAQPQPKQN